MNNYNRKLQHMIDISILIEDKTLDDLKNLQDFLHRNLKDKFARYWDI